MNKRHLLFLKDVFVMGVTAFGGPQAHLAMMQNLFVEKRNFLSTDELMETSALCSLLPGPGSTQTIVAIALKRGGVPLAIFALLVWILPASILMTILTLLYSRWEANGLNTDFLQFVQPMAIGIIAYSGFKIGITVIKKLNSWLVMLLALAFTVAFPSPVTFPLVFFGAGMASNLYNKKAQPRLQDQPKIDRKTSFLSFAIFIGIFILIAVLGALTKNQAVVLFENFYRFGSITYGGGQVLVPMMFEQFVKHRHFLTANEFLSGLAINQAMPGPAFSLATYTGGMALQSLGIHYQIIGCLIGMTGIFLPSILILIFVFPYWEYVRKFAFVNRALEGINAASTGMVLAAAIILYSNLGFLWINLFVVVATFLILNFTKIKAPLLIAFGLLCGFIYTHL